MNVGQTIQKMAQKLGIGQRASTLSGEIATRERVNFNFYLPWLPNPDPVLKKLGQDIQVYDELRSDGYVRGCIKSRKAGVLRMLYGIDRGSVSNQNQKLIESLLNTLNMPEIISNMLDAAQFGYSPIEVIWEQVGNYWLPKDLIGKPPEWFIFSADNKLKLRTINNILGEEVPDNKFILVRQEASYKNPYGFPDLSCCFWPVTFKKGGMKSWVTFAEKWGQVFTVGKMPRGASDGERSKLLDSLEQMVQDAATVISDDCSVELKESSGKVGSSGLYKELIESCKREISIVQLGHEGGAISTPGKLGGASSALGVRDDIINADKKIVEGAFNQLLKWIFEMNFTGPRPVFSMWREEDVDFALAQRDISLYKLGVRFNPEYITKNYDIPIEIFTMTEWPIKQNPDNNLPVAGQFSETSNEKTGQQMAQDDGILKSGIDGSNPVGKQMPIDLTFAFGLPPLEAVCYLESKDYEITADWFELWQEAHAKAFTVAHVARLDVLQDIRGMVEKAIKTGMTATMFKKQLGPMLKAKGWWGKQMIADAAGNIKVVQLGNAYRMDNIYRTNLQTAYMAGRYKTQVKSADILPYWQFVCMMDQRTRPSHAALNGKVFRWDDPFWNTHYPPLDWGCRCSVIARTKRDVVDAGMDIEDTTGALINKEVVVGDNSLGEERKTEITGFKTQDKTGKPVTVWTGPGWNYNPGKAGTTPDLSKYDKDIANLYGK